MSKRTYTEQEKAAALELLRDASLTFYQVRDQVAIPVATLQRWAKQAGLGRADSKTQAATARRRVRLQAKREALAETFLDRAAELEKRMDEPHIDFRGKDADEVTYPRATSGDVRNYSIAIAVLIDKFRLEMGEATGRVEIEQRPSRVVEERLDDLAERRRDKQAQDG